MNDAKAVSRYKPTAAETPQGQERERAYYEALGRFLTTFSRAEATMHLMLWHYAEIKRDTARAVFSGVRMETEFGHLRRIFETKGTPILEGSDLHRAFKQLKLILDTRNLIVHYGTDDIAEGNASVTNELLAHAPRTLTRIPMSKEILDALTDDTRKIVMHLLFKHIGRPVPKSASLRAMLENALHSPWRYTRPEQP